jgi:hypothetical protein
VITTVADRRELERLRRRVVSARRIVSGLQLAVAFVVLFLLGGVGADATSRDLGLNDIFLRAALTSAVFIAIGLVTWALTAVPRRRVVSRYLDELVRQESGLRLAIRDSEPTPLGRRFVLVGLVLVGLGAAGAFVGVIPPIVFVGLLAVGFVLLYVLAIDPDGAGWQLTRRPFTELQATSAELRWVADDGESEVVPWARLKRVARRASVHGIVVKAEWYDGPPSRPYPVHYRDRDSGEVVDLAAVTEAIRPPGFVVRRRNTWLDIDTSVEPIGAIR